MAKRETPKTRGERRPWRPARPQGAPSPSAGPASSASSSPASTTDDPSSGTASSGSSPASSAQLLGQVPPMLTQGVVLGLGAIAALIARRVGFPADEANKMHMGRLSKQGLVLDEGGQAIAEPLQKVLDKRLGHWFAGEMSDEAALALVVLTVVGLKTLTMDPSTLGTVDPTTPAASSDTPNAAETFGNVVGFAVGAAAADRANARAAATTPPPPSAPATAIDLAETDVDTLDM